MGTPKTSPSISTEQGGSSSLTTTASNNLILKQFSETPTEAGLPSNISELPYQEQLLREQLDFTTTSTLNNTSSLDPQPAVQQSVEKSDSYSYPAQQQLPRYTTTDFLSGTMQHTTTTTPNLQVSVGASSSDLLVQQAAQEQLAIDLRRQLCDQNLFVFHLPSHWDEKELRSEFGKFGSILSAKVVKRPDGTSKGYGFVCFTESLAACQAVEGMHGKPYAGKRLKVSLKKTPEECLHTQVQKLMELSSANQAFDRDRDCTLFVFHLPATWDDKEMYQQFQVFGTLLSAKIAKRPDGLSRGYGFATFDNPRAAALAIANMNGVDVGNKKRLKVQLKQQVSPQQPIPGCTIFIFHLPNDWTENHLRQYFNHYGKIVGATVQRDNRGNSKGYGFISFDRQQSAINAVIGMNGFLVGHKRLKVSLKKGECSELDSIHQTYFCHDDINYWDSLARNNIAVDFAQASLTPTNMAAMTAALQGTTSGLMPTYATSSITPSYTTTPARLGAVSHMTNYPTNVTNYSYPSTYPNYFQQHSWNLQNHQRIRR